MYNASPTIKYFKLENITNEAFYVDGGTSGPSFERNTVVDADHGVYMYDFADASLTRSILGSDANRITDHAIYICPYGGISLSEKYNNIYPNTSASKRGIYMVSSYNDIYAEHNYWGTPSPNKQVLFNYPNDVYSYPELTNPETTNIGVPAAKSAVLLAADYYINTALEYESKKDWDNALYVYYQIIKDGDNLLTKRLAIKRSIAIAVREKLDYSAIVDLVNDEITETSEPWYRASLEMIKADINTKEGNFYDAVSAFEELSDKYRGTGLEPEILSRLSVIYSNHLGNDTKARMYADQAASLNPGLSTLEVAYENIGEKYHSSAYNNTFDYAYNLDCNPDTTLETDDSPVTISPNPFNPSTTIAFNLARAGRVTLNVYSITGQKVATLVGAPVSSGAHTAVFDGSGYASGMYFYRLTAGGKIYTGKMLFMK